MLHRIFRYPSWPLHALVATALLVLGCDGDTSAGPAQPAKEAVRVSVARTIVKPLERTVEVVGSLHGDEQTTIAAKVPGRVQKIMADVGDRVAPGQPITQIDPTDYELIVSQRRLALQEALAKLGLTKLDDNFDVAKVATVERAKFQAANARAKLDRARELFQQKPPLISEQDFADMETAYEVAQRDYDVAQLEARSQWAIVHTRESELNSALQQLADTVIRAPGAPPTTQSSTTVPAAGANSGEYAITRRHISPGGYVREGDAMFELVADNPVKYRAAVPERFLSDLRADQLVRLTVEGRDSPFTGRVSRINPAIEPQSRTFEIEALIDNEDRQLRPGAFARGTIVVGEDPEVTFVPQKAVISFAGVDRVFTVKDGKATEHVVQLGARRGDQVAVRQGLGGEHNVVVAGNQRLGHGDVVVVEAESPVTQAAP